MRPRASYFHTLLIVEKGGGKGCAHDTCKVLMGSKMWENDKKLSVFRMSIWVLPPFRPLLYNDNNSIKYVKSFLLTWKIHTKIHPQVCETSHESVSFTEINITDQSWMHQVARNRDFLQPQATHCRIGSKWDMTFILHSYETSSLIFSHFTHYRKGGRKGVRKRYM